MIHYLEYFKLLKPPTSKFVDKLIYFSLILLTAILVIPISMLKKKTIKEAIFIIFPKLMPKDLLVNFHGVKFIARKGKTDILLLNELSEPWMTKYFKPKKGEIVVDVGAHVGKYALVAAKMVGKNGRMIAIEAHPENFKALLKNIRLNGFNNIIALNVAAFNEDGKELELFGSMDDRYSLKLSEGPKIKVKTITIDSILRKYGIEKVDLVKIDVEGAEVEVLEGMRKIIDNSQNLKILVEVHSENRRKLDDILRGFKSENLGGDDPNVPVIFYWREGTA